MNYKEYLSAIKPVGRELENKIQSKLNNLTKPLGSLGRLEEIAKKYCLIRQTTSPILKNKVIFVLAGDHGIVEEGVSAFPQEVTQQMVFNFINGGAGINVLSKHIGAKVVVADLGVKGDIQNEQLKNKKVNQGTQNMAKGPAMTEEEAVQAIENGIDLAEEEINNGMDILGIGEMGIGNTTPASAITSAITGAPVENITGRGTGIDDKGLENKIEIIKKVLHINKPDKNDGLDVLLKVGGYEIGGMTGIILSAAKNNIPVIIDGFISSSAALIAYQLNPNIKDYLIASHQSVEKGHKIILDHLSLSPLLDLDLRLGEGTGSALGMSLVEAGIKIYNEMATFESAGVSEKDE